MLSLPQRLDDWLLEGLNGLNLLRARILGSCVTRMLVWHLWPERNNRTFKDQSLLLNSFGFYNLVKSYIPNSFVTRGSHNLTIQVIYL